MKKFLAPCDSGNPQFLQPGPGIYTGRTMPVPDELAAAGLPQQDSRQRSNIQGSLAGRSVRIAADAGGICGLFFSRTPPRCRQQAVLSLQDRIMRLTFLLIKQTPLRQSGLI